MVNLKPYLFFLLLFLSAFQGLSQLHDLSETARVTPDEKLYWQANQAALDKDFKTVIKVLNEYLKRNKENEHAYLLRSEAHFFYKNYKKAIEDCRTVLALGNSPSEHDYTAMWNLANAYIGLGKFDEALNYLDACKEHDKQNVKFYEVKIYTYFQLEDYDAAIQEAKALLTIDATSLKAHYGIAKALLSQEKFPEALEAFNQTLALHPNYAIGYQNRGSVKLALNDLSGSCEDWKKSLELGLEASKFLIGLYCR